MTDRKISELVAVTSVDDADEFVLARSGSSNKVTAANMGLGGGSQPITRSQYDVALAAVPGNTQTKMPLVLNYGTALLDLTSTPDFTPVVSGTYAFVATVSISGLISAASTWSLLLTLDEDDFAVALSAAALDGTSGGVSTLPLTFPFYVPAGSPCWLAAQHDDLGNAVAFTGHVYVQRLS